MLLTTDSEKCCIKTKDGFVLKGSNIKQVDNGLGIVCPWHANYYAKIVSVKYGILADALVVERWFAEKVAREIGGKVIKLEDAELHAKTQTTMPLKSMPQGIADKIRAEIISRFSKNWFSTKDVIDFTNFAAQELSKALPSGNVAAFSPIEVLFQDLTEYVKLKGKLPSQPVSAWQCERGEISKCNQCKKCDDCDKYYCEQHDINKELILGLCCDKGKYIIYHSDFLKSFWVCGVSIVEVILHEVFHWFQHQIIKSYLHSGIYKNPNSMARHWEKNFDNYIEPWMNYDAYKTQSVERNANFFAWYILLDSIIGFADCSNKTVLQMIDENTSFIVKSITDVEQSLKTQSSSKKASIEKYFEGLHKKPKTFTNLDTVIDFCIWAAWGDTIMQGAGNTSGITKYVEEVQAAKELLKKEIERYFKALPIKSLADFDKWHENICDMLIACFPTYNADRECAGTGRKVGFTYGNAQKFINMTFKDMFAVLTAYPDILTDHKDYFVYCHMPIDDFIKRFIKAEIEPKRIVEMIAIPWSTQTNYSVYMDAQGAIAEYIKNCEKYRGLTVLESEFEIWERYKP